MSNKNAYVCLSVFVCPLFDKRQKYIDDDVEEIARLISFVNTHIEYVW